MTVARDGGAAARAVKTAFITYGYVIDDSGRLLGIITMRDLLFADEHETRLDALMLRDPFYAAARDCR